MLPRTVLLRQVRSVLCLLSSAIPKKVDVSRSGPTSTNDYSNNHVHFDVILIIFPLVQPKGKFHTRLSTCITNTVCQWDRGKR